MGERVSHYEIRALLGRGGMGEVYEAFDLKAKRSVAIKFIAPEVAADPDAFRRFEAEAHNAAQLNHPHIATLYEFEPEGERPFIAMELVTGPSLRDRIRAGRLEIAEALGVARDVASALAYAHRRKIIHRDIKPENLMFDEDGRIKVMDFGLARALLASRLTVTGSSLGTPSYMAPESLTGSAGPEADVFALGLVLQEMLTGAQVFTGDSPFSVMYAIANVEPPALSEQRPEAPDAVGALIARLLAKDPVARLDAAGAARALAELTGVQVSIAEGPSAPRIEAAAEPARSSGITADRDESAVERPSAPPAPRPRVPVARVALGVVAIVVVALAVWIVRRPRGEAAVPPDAVILNNQAYAALQQGDLARAQALAESSLARAPHFGRAQFNRARLYDLKGQADSAAAVYAEILRTASGRDHELAAMTHYNLADLSYRSGAYAEAVDHFRRSVENDSTQAHPFNGLGLALVRANRPQEALGVLERAIAKFPNAAPLFKNAGLAAIELERDSLALGYLDRAIRIDPSLSAAFGLRARVRARLGDPAGALVDWGLFVSSAPAPSSAERDEVARDLASHGIKLP